MGVGVVDFIDAIDASLCEHDVPGTGTGNTRGTKSELGLVKAPANGIKVETIPRQHNIMVPYIDQTVMLDAWRRCVLNDGVGGGGGGCHGHSLSYSYYVEATIFTYWESMGLGGEGRTDEAADSTDRLVLPSAA